MSEREVYQSVKNASVAVLARPANPTTQRPFKIVGSGFCVHKDGIILTCRHVFEAFLKIRDREHHESVLRRVGEGVKVPVNIVPFSVLFFGSVEGHRVYMHEAGVREATIVKGFDIAILKVGEHEGLPDGFPTLEIANYEDVHEGMDVATCGYPFGDFLWDQTGSVNSSFTKGTLSSVCPMQGVPLEHLKMYQLDMLSAPGNSGGPVFCPKTGKVFGILSGGPVDPKGQPILGLSVAEPVHAAFQTDQIDLLLSHARSATQQPG